MSKKVRRNRREVGPSSLIAAETSVVEYFSSRVGFSCGYCNGRNTNSSYGMQAYVLSVEDYQPLIDRGWRRSGRFCYKPINNETCCPMYTIRCDATEFRITKSQKKILKKMGRFLRNELTKEETMAVNDDDRNILDVNMDDDRRRMKYIDKGGKASCELKLSVDKINNSVNKLLSIERESCCPKKPEKSPSIASKSDLDNTLDASLPTVTTETPAKGPCRKAKLIRIERKKNKLLAQGRTLEEIEKMFHERKLRNRPKSFDELFEESMKGNRKLEMRLVRVKSPEFKATLSTSAALYKKYQMAIHREPPGKCSEKMFVNFLCDSPLAEDGWDENTIRPPMGYGSFHEQYWLDGQLIAIGVIDILPYCVSSVYFIYDPDYSYLSLGMYSALREVYLTRQLAKSDPELMYYYMGFYIHTSPKTRYKARLRPSELLCTETNTWHEIGPCIKMLEKDKYSRFNTDMNATDVDGGFYIGNVMILYKSQLIPYSTYKRRNRDDEDEIREFAQLVGKQCVEQSMLLIRQSSDSYDF